MPDSAHVLPEASPLPPVIADNQINDARFYKDIRLLINLRGFLIKEVEGLTPEQSEAIKLGSLNDLALVKRNSGRRPTAVEWDKVEVLTQNMYSMLSEPLRKKFALGEVSLWFMAVPIFLVLMAAFVLSIGIYYRGLDNPGRSSDVFLWYLGWVIALGGMGSIAFISMNSLSVQQDATFDMTNGRLLLLRIITGALFAMVLSVPFGAPQFIAFLDSVIASAKPAVAAVATASAPASGKVGATVLQQSLYLILPFVLGFSTSLVILIMNRLVEAAQTFFGKGPLSPEVVKEVRQAKSSMVPRVGGPK
jgi:hypothetical protein